MKSGIRYWMAAIILISFIVAGCGAKEADASATQEINAIRTEAVSTFIAAQTKSAAAIPAITFTPPVVPTSTATPEMTGTAITIQPVAACYKLLYRKDVTIPDYTVMLPKQKFTKTWLVLNNGDCAWAPGFTFSAIGGDAMSGRPYVLKDPVPVGSAIEISIDMVAPADKTGTIQGTWQMADANGNNFGNALFVFIVIGGNQTGTPAPPSATPTQ
jgi:Ig-like domain-containing protein